MAEPQAADVTEGAEQGTAAAEETAAPVFDVQQATHFDPRVALREIAQPRLCGSDGAVRTTGFIRAQLHALGYDVQERGFVFSPWPGRVGISIVGGLYLIASFAAAALIYNDRPYVAISVLLVLLILAALIAALAGPVIDALPFGRMQGSNLFATPASGRVRYIIMAHRDSKSQPVPLSFRGPAIIIGIIAWLGLFIGALAHAARDLPGSLILALGIAATIAGVILIFCYVDNQSPGALDNASGVAAAMGIAARERDAGDVALLITDAEELGLAGSRAAARNLPKVFGVINLDGLDDDGTFYVFERFGVLKKKGLAPHIAAPLLQEAEARGWAADRRDMPFGIPVDHIPVVKAGTPALTLMRGSIASLRRVHRPGDDLDHLRGDGVVQAVDLVCGALARMREQAASLER